MSIFQCNNDDPEGEKDGPEDKKGPEGERQVNSQDFFPFFVLVTLVFFIKLESNPMSIFQGDHDDPEGDRPEGDGPEGEKDGPEDKKGPEGEKQVNSQDFFPLLF